MEIKARKAGKARKGNQLTAGSNRTDDSESILDFGLEIADWRRARREVERDEKFSWQQAGGVVIRY